MGLRLFSSLTWSFLIRFRLVRTLAISYKRRTLAEQTRTNGKYRLWATFKSIKIQNMRAQNDWRLTFILAVAGLILTLLDQNLSSCIEGNGLCFGHQEQHDKLLAHDAKRFILPSAGSRCMRETNHAYNTVKHVVVSGMEAPLFKIKAFRKPHSNLWNSEMMLLQF